MLRAFPLGYNGTTIGMRFFIPANQQQVQGFCSHRLDLWV